MSSNDSDEKPSRELVRRVLKDEFVAVSITTLVHRDNVGQAVNCLTSSVYNGILDLEQGRPLTPEELEEVIEHEYDCTMTGDNADGYIDWDEFLEN